jgi:diguanylate cyclase (GGDEF)-like protein
LLYIVFGEHSEHISKILSPEFEVAGYDRTIDAAISIAQTMSKKPEEFLILGTALITGIYEGSINYGKALLENLKKLRDICPESRIILILSNRVSEQVVNEVAKLGIYDIHKVESLKVDALSGIIRTKKNFSNYSITVETTVSENHEIEVISEKDTRQPLFAGLSKTINSALNRVESFKEQVEAKIQKKSKDTVEAKLLSNAQESEPKPLIRASEPKLETLLDIPDDFVFLEDDNIDGITSLNPTVILVPVSIDAAGRIKNIRRKIALSSVPIVVIGECDESLYYAAGADECIKDLNGEATAKIRAKASRMKEIWSEANRDELTGALRRKFMDKYLDELATRFCETGTSFSITISDLDHFKSVNDTYGHQAGDVVLIEFARFLRESIRKTDVIIRYGGEEFLIVFPGLNDAGPIMEKLCRSWASKEITLPDGNRIKSTFSAGLAVIGRDALGVDDLIKSADEALYLAKKSGRNKVVKAGEMVEIQEGKESPVIKEQVKMPSVSLPLKKLKINNAMIIGVCSPSVSAGATSFAVLLAKKLAKRNKVAAFDCDLSGKGLGVRMGLQWWEIEKSDWTNMLPPAEVSGVYVYPMDPANTGTITGNQLSESLKNSTNGVNKLVLDLGSNMGQWWFKLAQSTAHIVLWVIKDDPLIIEKAKLSWPSRPRISSREIMILFGEGNPRQIEEIFMLPCLQVTEKKGWKEINRIFSGDISVGPRILVVGFKKVPMVDGFVLDSFQAVDEALEWVKYNTPDAAILAEKTAKATLLEYDLKKINIPMRRAGTKDFVKAINELGISL